MLKFYESVKSLEHRAGEALLALLQQVPVIERDMLKCERRPWDGRYDFVVGLHIKGGGQRTLVCEVKSNGQPRHVRNAVLALRDWVDLNDSHTIPVLLAPYLSPEAREICQTYEVGYLDLEGNCRLAFDGIYIDRQVPTKPAVHRRDLKSLFTPKAEQVLRVLFREPSRPWRVTELAHAARVSIGHVSNVRNSLINKEWAEASTDGLHLAKPNELLDAWQQEYVAPGGHRLSFYTLLHGAAFDMAVRDFFKTVSAWEDRVLLASFSAARWQAPFAKSGSQFLYAGEKALPLLIDMLKLTPASRGENVVIFVPEDEGVLLEMESPAPDIYCTCPIQTYLDLSISGERGREAAEHLRHERLKWF